MHVLVTWARTVPRHDMFRDEGLVIYGVWREVTDARLRDEKKYAGNESGRAEGGDACILAFLSAHMRP